jgi:DNA invertase Pin-like site-specific DNA recombinase
MKKTVAYCRTALASETDPLAKVSAQTETVREFARQHGMTVHETYMDAAASGRRSRAPALQQLLADCRAGKIGVVITRDADRLSRDTSQLCALLHRFAIDGVRVQFANENGEAERKLVDLTLSALADLHEARGQ